MLTLKTRYHYGQCAKYLRPLFEKTIAAWQAEPHCLPNNYASWSVEQAMKRDDKLEQSSDMLARRAMALNFAAVHTTTMTAANLILDLASSTKEPNDLGRVRREADYVQERYDKRWSRAMLAEMSLLDSALRESMRVSGFGTKVFNRKVTASRGVMLPNGLHVSHGANVAVSGYSMHHDEAIYQEPQRFIASRFMGSSHASGSEKATPRKTAVTTEFSYGIWGHGRHACPGRFFAVDMIKMIVAYLVSNFDIKPLHKRPKNLWVADVVVPDRRVTIKLRRRK